MIGQTLSLQYLGGLNAAKQRIKHLFVAFLNIKTSTGQIHPGQPIMRLPPPFLSPKRSDAFVCALRQQGLISQGARGDVAYYFSFYRAAALVGVTDLFAQSHRLA